MHMNEISGRFYRFFDNSQFRRSFLDTMFHALSLLLKKRMADSNNCLKIYFLKNTLIH